ncbi:astacin (Peptidase family m12A) domain-containing protein [Ditylenchus destructor]|uniref:Metalloendopeptidase n=1 Tax=Ditylenchus destructor TaxID=166010 RepID=A0AAD4NF91_9BILA|nr:astacin (Peptidase family m12A) domain-containing protein [Ditylenchus destructor]
MVCVRSCVLKADIGDGDEIVEVRRLLDEIKVAAIEKHGAFYDPMEVARTKPRAKPFTDGTEASVNWELTDQLFENDILLTLPQAKHILDEVKSSDWKNLIRSGLRHVESHTCIRFTESSSSQDYLQYIRGSGCWSSVGRTGGRQQVSIGYGCDALGIVAHETLHALGLWHEQSRTDRDTYININFDEIYPGTQSNFEKRTPSTSDNMGQPYDLGSVMHYGSKAFAIDYNAYSVITRDSAYQQTIGQRAGISFKDAKMINLRYCSKVCTQKLACQNGGYTDPNNCNRCKCPDGYGGTHCQQIPQSNVAACRGGEYTADTKSYYITSPQVTSRASCYYRIKAPANQRIELTVNKINFPCKDACESYVELKYKLDKIATGARLCCSVPKSPIISESNEVLMILKGEDNIPNGYEGFRITYRLVGAPTTTRSTTYAPGESTESSTSEATTTTTPVSTTPKPDPTPAPSPSGSRPEWSDWAAWSECTANCGGCGERKRLRACYGGDRKCSGLPYEISKCGTQPCPVPAGKINSTLERFLIMTKLIPMILPNPTHPQSVICLIHQKMRAHCGESGEVCDKNDPQTSSCLIQKYIVKDDSHTIVPHLVSPYPWTGNRLFEELMPWSWMTKMIDNIKNAAPAFTRLRDNVNLMQNGGGRPLPVLWYAGEGDCWLVSVAGW